MVIWIVGMSGSGKTTLAKAMQAEWERSEIHVVRIDGDDIRAIFGQQDEAAYTIDGRRRNAERIVSICEWLDRQNIPVICSILAIFPDILAANRARFSRYGEIYLRAPLAELAGRDQRNIYAPALSGQASNVVGVDIPFPEPSSADVTIDTGGTLPDIRQLAASTLSQLLR